MTIIEALQWYLVLAPVPLVILLWNWWDGRHARRYWRRRW